MNALEICMKPKEERTLEERLTLLEKENEELRNQIYHLRVSLDGSMSLGRRIEEQFVNNDKVVTWLHKIICQNYNFIVNH